MKNILILLAVLLTASPAMAADTQPDIARAMERLMGAVIRNMEKELPKIIDQVTRDMNKAAEELEKKNVKPIPKKEGKEI